MIKFSVLITCALISACAAQTPPAAELRLPAPVANNAVTLVGDTALSFGGLLSGKTWEDTTHRAFACELTDGTCREIAGLPDGIGRLASVAVTVQNKAYVFGGYTVAADGAEVSTPQIWAFDVRDESYQPMKPMPVPVDDAMALVYLDRYVFLVSGWHDHDNVDLVQVFDTQENRWFSATAFPGNPVFGHAGGIVDEVMLVCDGVKVVPPSVPGARRTFEGSPACWRGEIDRQDLTQINWSLAGSLPPAGYRMAGAGFEGAIWFAGGTDNPYNYNGIGYNKVPAQPSQHVWRYDIITGEFEVFADKPMASMDHRGLLVHQGQFVIVGGIGENQQVLDTVQVFKPSAK